MSKELRSWSRCVRSHEEQGGTRTEHHDWRRKPGNYDDYDDDDYDDDDVCTDDGDIDEEDDNSV